MYLFLFFPNFRTPYQESVSMIENLIVKAAFFLSYTRRIILHPISPGIGIYYLLFHLKKKTKYIHNEVLLKVIFKRILII